MRKIFYLALIITACRCFAFAVVLESGPSQTFTLDSYIQAYVKNSPELVRQYNALRAAEIAHQNIVMGLFLPTAGASAGTTLLSNDTSGLRFDNPYDASLYVNWNIFNSGRDYMAYIKQKNALEISRMRFKNYLQDTVLAAIRVFYDLKLKERLTEVALRDLADKKDQLEMTTLLYRDGQRSYTDLLFAENNYKDSQLRLATGQADYMNTLISFNNLIGRGINAPAELIYELNAAPENISSTFEEDLKIAIAYREDINAAILRLHNSKIDEKLAVMNNLPTITAGFGYANTATDIFGNASNSQNYSVGLSLNVPIGFLWINHYNDIRISKMELVNSYMDFESLYRNIQADISRTRTSLTLDFTGMEISANNLKISEERLNITRAKYNDGAVSLLELSTAQDQYLSSQIADNTYRYNLQLSQYQYRRMLGLDIYDTSALVFDTREFADNKIKQIDRDFLNKR